MCAGSLVKEQHNRLEGKEFGILLDRVGLSCFTGLKNGVGIGLANLLTFLHHSFR